MRKKKKLKKKKKRKRKVEEKGFFTLAPLVLLCFIYIIIYWGKKKMRVIYLLLIVLGCVISTVVGQGIQPVYCTGEGPCNDNNECTMNDVCYNGLCVGTPKDCGGRACDPINGACVDCRVNADCRSPPNLCMVGSCQSEKCFYNPINCPSPFSCNSSTGVCSILTGPPVPRCNPYVQTLMNTPRVFQLNAANNQQVSTTTQTVITRLPSTGTLYTYVSYNHTTGSHIPACMATSARSQTNVLNYATDFLTPIRANTTLPYLGV